MSPKMIMHSLPRTPELKDWWCPQCEEYDNGLNGRTWCFLCESDLEPTHGSQEPIQLLGDEEDFRKMEDIKSSIVTLFNQRIDFIHTLQVVLLRNHIGLGDYYAKLFVKTPY